MLRRLTNNQNIEPLRTFVDVVEPLKIYQRGQAREFTQQSPYTRVMDAARPDQNVAREFRQLVASFLADGANDPERAGKIIAQFQVWAQNHEELVPIIEKSPILREIESLSEDLKTISLIGLELMSAIERGDTISNEKAQEYTDSIKAAKKSRGQVELQVVQPVEQLLNYAK